MTPRDRYKRISAYARASHKAHRVFSLTHDDRALAATAPETAEGM